MTAGNYVELKCTRHVKLSGLRKASGGKSIRKNFAESSNLKGKLREAARTFLLLYCSNHLLLVINNFIC